jgi:hypothetical protein
VTLQARNLAWQLQDGTLPVTVLVYDLESKFTSAFGRLFTCEGLLVARTPPRVPGPAAARVDGVHDPL